jgi:hypothetical protein
MTKAFSVEEFDARYRLHLDRIGNEMAVNFDAPAQRIINAGFARMGVPRFVGKDDRWEQVTCFRNGWDYQRPSAELMQRWASY